MLKFTKSYDPTHRVFQGTLTLLWMFHLTIMAGLIGGIHFEIGIGIHKYEITIGIHEWKKK